MRSMGCVLAVGIYGFTAPCDRLLKAKVAIATARMPVRVALGSLVAGNTAAMDDWHMTAIATVLFRHGLPRPVGLLGRAQELFACAGGGAVFGFYFLSAAGKRRLMARCRAVTSRRSLCRFAVAVSHRAALALIYHRMVRLAGGRGRTSAAEALLDCVAAALADLLLDAGPLSALPPYLHLFSVGCYNNDAAPADGGWDPEFKRVHGPTASFGDFALAFVGEAATTACFGCYALSGSGQMPRRVAIFVAHAAASVSAAWSAARLTQALHSA